MLRFGQVPRKVEKTHNSLLHLPFPFILMNDAPRCHDRDRVQSGAGTGYDALQQKRGRSYLNG
jgi:hypothetical protein